MSKVFVGGLDTSTSEGSHNHVTDLDLEQLFIKYGEVTKAQRVPNKPFGFVHMKNRSDADKAVQNLNRTELKGQRLGVDISRSKPVKLYVGKLPKDTTNKALSALFVKYGATVLECDVLSTKGFGFVHVETNSDTHIADKLIRALDQYVWDGATITVQYSESKRGEEQPSSMDQGGELGGRGSRGRVQPHFRDRHAPYPTSSIGGPMAGGRNTQMNDLMMQGNYMGGGEDILYMGGGEGNYIRPEVFATDNYRGPPTQQQQLQPHMAMGNIVAGMMGGGGHDMGNGYGDMMGHQIRDLPMDFMRNGGRNSMMGGQMEGRNNMMRGPSEEGMHRTDAIYTRREPVRETFREPVRDRWEPAAARDKVESREVVCLDEEKPEVKPGADTDKIIADMENENAKKNLISLGVQLTDLVKGSRFIDTHIQCNGATFKCHGVILAAKSKIFADTLSNSDTISLPKCSAALVNILLKFMYSGNVELDSLDTAELPDLVQAAETYQIEGAKNAITVALAKGLCKDTLVTTLELADSNNMMELRNILTKYIIANRRTVLDNPAIKAAIKRFPDVMFEIVESI